MLKKGKKLLSVLLVVLMLMTSAPLSIMAELNFTSLVPDLSVRSQAVNTTYNAVAAAEYAKKYALSYNKEWYFYNSGGDCANFVSQALFAAGMPMTADWHAYDSVSHAYRMDGGEGYGFTWIRAQNLADYLVSIGGQRIVNPSASDISIGDAIFYDWDGGRLDHSAVVTDIINGVPRVSAHSTPESASKLNENWTYNRSSNKIVLIKLYGKTCEENNSPDYDYYHMNFTTGVYASPSYSTTSIGSVSYLDTVRVISTTVSGGTTWGYFNYKGNWGWVDLSKATYKGHFDRIQVNHIFGNWFTVKQATCVEDGLERHICSRCGFTQDRTIAKGGHVAIPATCTKASVCSVCGVTLASALGHVFTQWVSVAAPTCVDKEKFEHTCKRCNLVEEKYGELGDHNYVATVTIPGCTADGTSALKCTYCGNGYIEDIGDGWSSWTTTANSTLLQNSSLYQQKTQYRYRDKEFTESTNANLSGWTQYGTPRVDYGSWGNWGDYSTTRRATSDTVDEDSRIITQYNFVTYNTKSTGGQRQFRDFSVNGNYSAYGLSSTYGEFHYTASTTSLNGLTTVAAGSYTSACSFPGYNKSSKTGYIVNDGAYNYVMFIESTSNYTEYRYRERSKTTTYYYYKWPSTWSNWQDAAVSGTGDRQVETRTVYRYKLAALNHDFGDPTVVPAKCTEKGYTEKICKRCGFSYQYDYVNALGHDMGAWYTVVEATPDTAGLERRDCQRIGCDYFETRGHSLVKKIIDPTCTKDGYTLWTCSDEGCTVAYTTDPVPALGHDLGDLIEIVAPKCEEDGLGRRDCSRCEYYEEETISAIGHDYQKIEEKSLAPTCTEDGYDYYECSHASEHNYTVKLDPLDHNWSEWEDHQPTKCGEEGYWFRTCDRCSKEEQKDFYYIEHNWVVTEEHDPTCLEDGYTVETCVNEWPDGPCGEIRITIGEPALGHDFGPYYKTKDATCTEEGIERADCIRSDAYEENAIPMLGHEADNNWVQTKAPTCSTEGEEQCKCVRHDDGVTCDKTYTRPVAIDPDAHDWDDGVIDPVSTCKDHGTKTYTCKLNGEHKKTESVPLDGNNHDGGTYIKDDKAATCIVEGYTGDTYCSGCNIKLSDGEVIPALGHDMGSWSSNDNSTHTRSCQRENCDYEETVACTFGEWEEIKAATCTVDGEKARTCTVCGYIDKDVISAFGHEPDNNWIQTKAPTCSAEGEEQCKCVRHDNGVTCDKIYTRSVDIDPEAHNWDDGIIDPVSTCKDHGTKTYTCKLNSEHKKTESVPLDSNNHDGGTYIKDDKAATCTVEGYTGDTYCSGCDAKLSDGEIIPALGHKPDNNWVQTKAPTCSAEGEEQCKCVRHDDGVTCDQTFTRPVAIDPEAHDWSDEWQVITEATMYEPGEEICHCKIDENHTQTRKIPVRIYYTATFKVDDETVAEIRFEPGTKYIDEPDLKPYDKDNYTVDWEEYTLNDADIVINAVYTPIDPDDISDLDTDKTVDNYENGIATITLSASAASRTIKFVSKENVTPLDVVLVLDRSGSMKDPLGKNSGVTKIDKLKDSANLFLEKLNENAQLTGADHRVALVGFGSGSDNSSPYAGTGVMITNSSGEISYRDIENGKWDAWGDTLIPVGDEKGVNERLTNCINAIKANGATRTDLGLKMAGKILGDYENTPDRKRMVVLITDGNPTKVGNTSEAIKPVVPPAITSAEIMKSTGVSIYTIGVTADANPDAKFNSSPDGITGSGDRVNFDFNRFLNIVSSNYPQAQAMDNYGEKVNSGYYIGVNDVEKGLENALEKIFINTVEKPLIFKKATIYDTLSKDFTLTLEQEQAMREKLTSEYGMADEDIFVTRNEDGTTTLRFVDVPVVKTLVDGNIRYVAKVTFDCSLNKYEAGDYETNTDDAGVEIDGENAAQFEKPQQIHIPSDRNIVIFTINGEVYRIWEGHLGDKVIVPETDLAKWNIDETVDGNYAVYEADEINSDQYTVTWIVDGTETVETYTFAQKIIAPVPADKDNLEFKGWSPSVPNIMPAKNMQFTAVFGPRHEHSYTKLSINGNCETGLIQVKACSCGAYITEDLGTRQHSYYSIVDCCTEQTVHEVLNCYYCDQVEEHTLRFEISKGKNATVIDFSLLHEGVEVQPNGNGIKVMIPMSSLGLRQKDNVYVKRVNDDGTKKDFDVTKENGYIVFYADHFSYYVIGLLDENGDPVEDIGYEDAYCIAKGHSYTQTVVVDPTCTEDGYTKHTCEVCGSSYNDSEVPALGHDFNDDAVCKTCGYDKKLDCDCGCHKNPVIKLIFFFIGILYKAFGLEFHCTCGIVH